MPIKSRLLLPALSILLLTSVKAQTIIKNPILAGFYADPSICKVKDDYYLINSTFSYYPGIPVFHSKDLKNWKQIGSVISNPQQLNFMGDGLTRGLFAPAINYNNGTFYVTCTDIDKGGNFIVTAKNPSGPWSKPIYIKELNGGIDPSLFFEGENAYIVYNSNAPDNKPLYSGHRTVRVYQLDLNSLKVLGDETILVNGVVDIKKKPVWIEGPHIYKRGEYYYLMAAEGGTSVNHSEVIFRSHHVKGPYIPYENNPILTQRDLNHNRKNPISSVGHADLVEGPDGNTYAVFLGVRPYEGDYYNTGRETFIAPVKWIDNWPIINPDFVEVQYQYPVSWKEVPQKSSLPISGNFTYKIDFVDTLHSQFAFLRTLDTSWFEISKQGLALKVLPETLTEKSNPAFIGKRQQHLNSEVEIEMLFSPNNENEKAGLAILQNEKHFYYLSKSVMDSKQVVQLFKSNEDGLAMELIAETELPNNGQTIFFKIRSEGSSYSFWYASKKNKWQLLKDNVDAKFLSTRTAGGFIGVFYGMYATSTGKPSDNEVLYKWFKYSGNDETFN